MPPVTAYQQFLKDPDQVERRGQLTAFIGPNAEKFLSVYDTMYAEMNRAPGEKRKFRFAGQGFCPAAFFVGPVWFFYRKLWWWGFGFVAISVALGFVPRLSQAGIALAIAAGYGAKRVYLGHAISTVSKLPGAGTDTLAKAGGVSKLAGWIAAIAYVLLVALSIYGVIVSPPEV